MKKKHLILSLFLSLSLLPHPTWATSQFNPNFIISDEELQDVGAMTRDDIQAFLQGKGGAIAYMVAPDANGVSRTTADIIYQAAKEYTINPKYLLVKLQKEQSLITTETPSQHQLDGATGYGITDGCGWSCDVFLRNSGFGKQVDAAAGIMRWYYDNVSTQGFIKRPGQTYNIDGTSVTPSTLATAFLYTYTPHLQGNQNFWNLWQKWFTQVYPDGSLLKTADSGDVYVLQDGKKRKIASMTVLISRYNPKLVITVPPLELARYEAGSDISFSNYSILKTNGTYYLIDGDVLRPFKDEATFKSYGYNAEEVQDVTATDIADYTLGEVLDNPNENPQGTLIRAKETKGLYFVKDNIYHPIYDEIIAKIAFPSYHIESKPIADLGAMSEGAPILFPDGTLIGITGSNKIYVVEAGQKRHIANEKVFVGLGYKWANILWTNDLMGIAHPTGEPLYVQDAIVTTTPTKPVAKKTTTGTVAKMTTPAPATTKTSSGGDAEAPVSAGASSKMVRAKTTESTGPLFTTDVDTYLIADAKTGEVLAGKNVTTIRPLASLTKVMTGFELLTGGLDKQAITTYDPAKQGSLYNYFRLVKGEMVRNSDLLNALLVSSLNTPARMLAQNVEDEPSFIAQMNAEAKAWGATKTTFTDVSGEAVENQTTASDYAILFRHALENSELKRYLGTVSYSYDEVLDLDQKPHHFDTNTNALVGKANLGFTIEASKTGYLDESGANLAMLVRRGTDGREFIVITMGNADYAHRFDEPERLTKWALSTF